MSFFTLLSDPHAEFLRYALISGLFASVAFAITGTYVVVRRSGAIAGAIAHSVLGGIGIASYLNVVKGIGWFTPLIGALVAALVSAVVIGLVTLHAQEREDSVIAAIWAGGMAVGLLFLHKTPGNIDAMSYIMGDILLISRADLVMVIILDVVVVAVGFLFYSRFLAICFDEEFARLRGVRANLYYLLLLCLTGLSIVLLSRLVGIIMVIALLVIPSAIASQLSKHLWQMMILSALACMLFITAGMAASIEFDLPSGPTIIVVAAGFYLIGLGGKAICRR
ncbi:metal ABC transporter permease [soil metagenome]